MIEKVQDLDIGVISELPVGEIGLPCFIWLLSFKSDVAGPRTLFGLRNYLLVIVQDPANG